MGKLWTLTKMDFYILTHSMSIGSSGSGKKHVAGLGLLGLLGFVGSMLRNIKKAARTVRHCAPSAARTITCAGAAALCGAMVCGLADYLWK